MGLRMNLSPSQVHEEWLSCAVAGSLLSPHVPPMCPEEVHWLLQPSSSSDSTLKKPWQRIHISCIRKVPAPGKNKRCVCVCLKLSIILYNFIFISHDVMNSLLISLMAYNILCTQYHVELRVRITNVCRLCLFDLRNYRLAI